MTDLTQKTRIPLAWAAAIIMALLGVVFNAGMSYARFSSLEQKVVEIQVSRVEQTKGARQQQLKVQRLDLTLDNMNKHLQSIDRKLDRMERK